MWGRPERILFSLREPAGYMASAKKKFAQQDINSLQRNYINVFNKYNQIGGDIIEYKQNLETKDYLLFLKPLQLDENRIIKFVYQGKTLAEDTNEQMWSAYHQFKEKYQDKILNKANQ